MPSAFPFADDLDLNAVPLNFSQAPAFRATSSERSQSNCMPRAQGCTAMVMCGGGDIYYCVDAGRLCRAQYD